MTGGKRGELCPAAEGRGVRGRLGTLQVACPGVRDSFWRFELLIRRHCGNEGRGGRGGRSKFFNLLSLLPKKEEEEEEEEEEERKENHNS
ncbi:hypothetical protein EYF80_043183 [Liparis tanakae]|uniref:Uncharacterized protein n=1 Tax=Liparis tanakae TaxID=230148 RepID=A0A4Z2FZ52_9TELE|nr:hypothetical protein EYF80_043183 [Liparis tanakae]